LGLLGGANLQPGLYSFLGGAGIGSNATINGSATDTFIFHILGDLNVDAAA